MFNNFTETELTNERWKDIDGYDGAYQVSDLGRVRSKYRGDWKVRRPVKDKKGYLTIQLHRNKNKKTYKIHRLVARAFIHNDNIFNDQVNHRNEIKSDNRAVNLEWCTASYNNAYNGLRKRQYHPKPKRSKVNKLYDPNLTYEQNLEIFRANGVECSTRVIHSIRKDLGLVKLTKKNI